MNISIVRFVGPWAATALLLGVAALAQNPPAQSAQRPATSAPSAASAAAPAAPTDAQAARKAAILNSAEWRRMMFELNEWFTVQPFYSPQQVQQIKHNLSASVAKMSPDDLEFMLQDMEAKLKMINSPEAKEARDWLGHYLSLVSGKKREEVLKELPNLATSTAAQLQQELRKIEQQRAALARRQESSARIRQTQVDNQLAADRAAQQAYIRQQNQAPNTYFSPYRNPSAGGKPPYSNVHTGPNMEFYSGVYGGFGVIFNPSSY